MQEMPSADASKTRPHKGVESRSRFARYGLRGVRVGEASHPGPTGGEFGRFSVFSEEDEVDVVPGTRRLVLVSQHATQLDSLSAPGGAVQFGLRSDTESVLSGPEVPQDAFGEDVESVDDEVWSVAGTEEVVSEVEAEVEVPVLGRRPLQAAFLALDQLNVEEIFKQRACVMKVVPQFQKGSYRNAMRVALEEACAESHARQGRGWKLFMMLPRMLLHRPVDKFSVLPFLVGASLDQHNPVNSGRTRTCMRGRCESRPGTVMERQPNRQHLDRTHVGCGNSDIHVPKAHVAPDCGLHTLARVRSGPSAWDRNLLLCPHKLGSPPEDCPTNPSRTSRTFPTTVVWGFCLQRASFDCVVFPRTANADCNLVILVEAPNRTSSGLRRTRTVSD